MRLSILSVALLLFAGVEAKVGLLNRNHEHRAPNPEPAAVGRKLKQATRRQIEARADPDVYMGLSKRDGSQITVPNCKRSLRPDMDKRDGVAHSEVYILSPSEAAAFFLGRGQLTLDNGTMYHDLEYAKNHRKVGTAEKRGYYRAITDAIGDRVMQVAVPYYNAFKAAAKPDARTYLSANTAILPAELNQIEDAILARPDFEEVTVIGFRYTRKFIETARGIV